MGKRCAYPGCRTGRIAERSERKQLGTRPPSIFKVPKHMVQRWSEAVQLQLTNANFICELHFPNESVVREDCVVKADGGTEMIPRSKYFLVANAVPIAFQNRENVDDNRDNVIDLPGPSNVLPIEPIRQIQNAASELVVDDIPDDTERLMTDSDHDAQSPSNGFADHLLADDDMPDVPFEHNSDAMNIMSAESINDAGSVPRSDDDQEEQATNDEGRVCTVDDVIDRLKETLLPESWCWMMNPCEESAVVFVQSDRYTFQPRVKVFLHNDLSVTIQASDSEAIIEHESIMTSIEGIVHFLRCAETSIVCCGVGLEGETRAVNCSGFVATALYGKFVSTPRCIACRQRRKVLQNRMNRRKTDVRARYAQTKYVAQIRQRRCRHLEQKADTLKQQVRRARNECAAISKRALIEAISNLRSPQQDVV